MKMMINKEQK